jgi:hypothetical protein
LGLTTNGHGYLWHKYPRHKFTQHFILAAEFTEGTEGFGRSILVYAYILI